MNLKLFIALLSGGLAYILIVLKGLILRQPLSEIFTKGLIGLFTITLAGWVLAYFLEIFGAESENSSNHNSDQDNDRETSENQQQEDKENKFSPLNPTVLEVDNSEKEIEND